MSALCGVEPLCVAELATADQTQTPGVLFANLTGSGIALGSILLFTPIILNIIRHRTGEGISMLTFWMQVPISPLSLPPTQPNPTLRLTCF
jgi:hypothetical protein